MDSLLTSAEAARLLRVHPKHIYRLLARGLPARRAGGKWLFSERELLRWAEGARPATAISHEQAPPLLAANGDIAVEMLLGSLGAAGKLVGLVKADRSHAHDLLQRRQVVAAGSHGAVEAGNGMAWIHVVEREVGLVTRDSRLRSLGELRQRRLASRPSSAGVRAYLDAALDKSGVAPRRTVEYDSHREVVCAVARGDADVGIGSAAWAAQLGLKFSPLTAEPYGFILRTSDLGCPEIADLCEVLQSRQFRRALARVPGYRSAHTGTVRYVA
jgi:excisionase family DNA binding protein